MAIEVARARARVNGVADRVDFICAPAEEANLAPRAFDIVWCNAILHHLTDVLDTVLASMVRWAKPDGVVSFAEPTALSPALRRLRKLIPVSAGPTTEDERPLEKADLEIIRRHVPDLQVRHFSMLGRLNEFILRTLPEGSTLPRFNYEHASALKKLAVNAIALTDWALLSLPGLDRLGSSTIMWGHPRIA